MKLICVVINIGVVAYLGYQASSCIGMEQIASLNAARDPLVLSFVAVVAMFIVLRN